jgi:hypothetical protein
VGSALIVSSHCRNAAEVNRRDPTKKVAPSTRPPTRER